MESHTGRLEDDRGAIEHLRYLRSLERLSCTNLKNLEEKLSKRAQYAQARHFLPSLPRSLLLSIQETA